MILRLVYDRSARRTYQSSNFNYGRSHYQALVEDSWQGPRVDLEPRIAPRSLAHTETEDRLVTFNPDVVNPLLAEDEPETGKPYSVRRVGGERSHRSAR